MSESRLLAVKNLKISFFNSAIETEIIHGISFHLNANEILGVVGESGSGKSISSLAIMGLLPKKNSAITDGTIHLLDEELTHYNEKEFQKIRGNDLAMIFQEPMSLTKSFYDLWQTSNGNYSASYKY